MNTDYDTLSWVRRGVRVLALLIAAAVLASLLYGCGYSFEDRMTDDRWAVAQSLCANQGGLMYAHSGGQTVDGKTFEIHVNVVCRNGVIANRTYREDA